MHAIEEHTTPDCWCSLAPPPRPLADIARVLPPLPVSLPTPSRPTLWLSDKSNLRLAPKSVLRGGSCDELWLPTVATETWDGGERLSGEAISELVGSVFEATFFPSVGCLDRCVMRLIRYLGGRAALHRAVRKASLGEVMWRRPHRLIYVVWAERTFLVVCSSTLCVGEMVHRKQYFWNYRHIQFGDCTANCHTRNEDCKSKVWVL